MIGSSSPFSGSFSMIASKLETMKPFYVLLALFTFLLVLVGVAQFYNPLPGLTGVPHPEIKGMMISSGNTDQFEHLRWLGYFFALGVVGVFGCIYFIGNLKKGQITGIGKWLIAFTICFALIFTVMIFSNWNYVQNADNQFFAQMPIPTAWMIYAVWLFPYFITILYMWKFEEWVISPEEEAELAEFLANRTQHK